MLKILQNTRIALLKAGGNLVNAVTFEEFFLTLQLPRRITTTMSGTIRII